MELWIRSQDKKHFKKAEHISVSSTGLSVLVNGIVFGTYESEKRTIKILDDIEKMLVTSVNIKGNYEEADIKLKSFILCNMCKVFELPEK